MQVKIDLDILNKVMTYLASRPFAEVAEIIKEVHSTAKIVEEIKESESESQEQQG